MKRQPQQTALAAGDYAILNIQEGAQAGAGRVEHRDLTVLIDDEDAGVFDSTLCIYAGTAQDLVVETSIPGGLACPSCWTETTPGFKYKVPGAGIEKILLKSGTTPGKAKIVLKGKGAALPSLPTVPVTLPLVVQMNNTEGECWEATYTNAIKNEDNFLKAKGD